MLRTRSGRRRGQSRIDSRVADLEQQVAALREQLDLPSGLRASEDRDLSSLTAYTRATNHVVQALAITQSGHTETLAQHTDTLARHTEALSRIEAQTTGDMVEIRQLLTTLIERTS